MDFDAEGMTQQNIFAGDKKLHVRFYNNAIVDEVKTSLNGGVPVFVDTPFIQIMTPGDQTNIIDRPAWIDARHPNAHNNRFREQWAAYKAGEDFHAKGVPMSEFPALVESQRKTLKYLDIHTVEQLAGLADDHLQKISGGQELKRKAVAFLAARTDAAHAMKQQAELDKQSARLSELEAALAALRAQPTQASSPKSESKK